jgi:gas vesicle protein
MERNNGDTFIWFLIGAAAGAGLALLYAPQSGHKTRSLLGRKLGDGREAIEQHGSELLEKSRELFEKGRKVADDAAELFEKGRSMVKG